MEDQGLVLWLPISCQFYEYITSISNYQSGWTCTYFVGISIWLLLIFLVFFFLPTDLVSSQSTQSLSHRLELCLLFHTAQIILQDIQCSNLSVQVTKMDFNALIIWNAWGVYLYSVLQLMLWIKDLVSFYTPIRWMDILSCFKSIPYSGLIKLWSE